MPDWSRGGRDKLRAPLLAALFLFRLIGVWERALFAAPSPCKQSIKTNNSVQFLQLTTYMYPGKITFE